VIQAFGYFPSAAVAATEPRSDYFASKAHYQSLARRIAAVLSSGRFVLLTGDPPADPQSLSRALGNVRGLGRTVVDIRCGPGLSGKELARTAAWSAASRTGGGAVPTPECSVTAAPLFLFIDFDQLSDRQIAEICGGSLDGEELRAPGVLLAPLDFVARLERPALRFLKERVAAQICVQEVGDDEVVSFLHNQLLTQRDRRSETRGFRRGILTGLVACGVVAAAGSGGFVLLHSKAEQVCEAPAGIEESGSISGPASARRSPQAAATTAVPAQLPPPTEAETETTSALVAAPPAPAARPLFPMEGESPTHVATPAVADVQPSPALSASETAALMTRGDAFRSAGDITSARLYYERAADAGDGQAALRLAESFDALMLSLSGIHGVAGDPAKALSWYRRARDLGMAEADQRISSLEAQLLGKADSRPRLK
jgi:hypothetical protein